MEMEPLLEVEPAYEALLRLQQTRRKGPIYTPKRESDIAGAASSVVDQIEPGGQITSVSRLGGGASKEQFLLNVQAADGAAKRYVLRMDPFESINITGRRREFEILQFVQGAVPAPRPVWLDAEGTVFGNPSSIMAFVSGVTKPKVASAKVSGLGTLLGDPLRGQLAGQFVKHLVTIHGLDWRGDGLPSYTAPDNDSKQAARWTLNYWRQALRNNRIDYPPIVTLAEQWLLDNLPDCQEMVLTHGDYRTGNYLFDEARGEITAILDWELARVGDFHEDIGWVLLQLFGTFVDGKFRASDLFEREDFIQAYEAASGRTVNRKTLHFYEVLSSWKCYVITAACGMSVARAAHSHQDILLTLLGGANPLFTSDLCRLLKEDVAA